jgi:hypothetical protein
VKRKTHLEEYKEMKLNGLTNNLKGNDQSLSNSYLQHIVELLRKELESLETQFEALNVAATEHIENQKTVVETVTVKAEDINGKIKFLSNAIEMFGSAKLNGHNILTDETFQGPFIYKGEVEELPEDANIGDVYICDGKVSIYNGTSYDSFIIPVGMVSKAEYDVDQAEIKQDISDNTSDIAIVKEDVTQLAVNVGAEISRINTALADTVNKNPVDEKIYVRQNDEWIELSEAANTVKEVAGESKVSNTEEGVVIESPKVLINSEDIKVNGTTLTQADKFALTKTEKSEDVKTWYSYEYNKSPFGGGTDVVSSNPYYGSAITDASQTINSLPIKSVIATRDYQYIKYSTSHVWADDNHITLSSLDRNGKIKNMYYPDAPMGHSGIEALAYQSSWVAFNPEYCPDGFENKVYMMLINDLNSTKNVVLLEYDEGDFVQSIDLTDKLGQAYKDRSTVSYTGSGWACLGVGGKALRNKDIQRICIVSRDSNVGGSFVILVGGDANSGLSDPFDPTKAIYIPLPQVANGASLNMAVTDKAWYLTEDSSKRIMRITPNGRVTEYSLISEETSSINLRPSLFCYGEYIDAKGRPAVVYQMFQDATNGAEMVFFIEEKDDGNVKINARNMSPYVYKGQGGGHFRFSENDYYVFFTGSFGHINLGNKGYTSAEQHKMLFYWDKKTLTTHVISDVYNMQGGWSYCGMDLVKTKEGAIWVIPNLESQTAAQRTGEVKYISNVDYTNIDEDTGKDTGNIEIHTATLGTDYSWFVYNSDHTYTHFPYLYKGSDGWGYMYVQNRYFAVNDDGILCILSADFKAMALCYGDGNIKVYKFGPAGKDYKYYPQYQMIIPTELTSSYTYGNSLLPRKHGWLLFNQTLASPARADSRVLRNALTYISCVYRNGEPTILEMPRIDIHLNEQTTSSSGFGWYENYGYLLSYDDYEKRRKVFRDLEREHSYGIQAFTGCDGYWKEVEHNAKKKINLEYDGKIISSVEE